MTTKSQIAERREKVAQFLSKSVTSVKEISKALGIPYDTVQNDIQWLKAQVEPWLYGLVGIGYSFDCKMAIEKLLSIERDLEEMRQSARIKHPDDIMKRILILRELRGVTISRMSFEGEGPTLLALQKFKNGEFNRTY